eukprot:764207-Hanusia_phi.AAC.2
MEGCGWCSEGGGICMEGGLHGPMCSTCGSNCSCSWSYGQCRVSVATGGGLVLKSLTRCLRRTLRSSNETSIRRLRLLRKLPTSATARALCRRCSHMCRLENLEDVVRDGKIVRGHDITHVRRAMILMRHVCRCYSGKQGYADAMLEKLSSLKQRLMSRNTMDAGSLYS